MDYGFWIALAGIALTAANLVYNARRDSQRMRQEEQLLRVRLTEDRALQSRVDAFERLSSAEANVGRAVDVVLWLFQPVDPFDLIDETEAPMDAIRDATTDARWFQYLGWTSELRAQGEAVVSVLDKAMVVVWHGRSRAISVLRRHPSMGPASDDEILALLAELGDLSSQLHLALDAARDALDELGELLSDS